MWVGRYGSASQCRKTPPKSRPNVHQPAKAPTKSPTKAPVAPAEEEFDYYDKSMDKGDYETYDYHSSSSSRGDQSGESWIFTDRFFKIINKFHG